jgi:hypothetical protein
LKQSEPQPEVGTTSRALPHTNGDLHGHNGHLSGKPLNDGTCLPQSTFASGNGAASETAVVDVAQAASDHCDTAANGESPAFELKFLVEEERAAEVERWAAQYLVGDEHGDPALGGAYLTTSLYCDTPELDVYHRAPWYRRRKFRIRSYAGSPTIFLERKTRREDRVAKRRTAILAEQLPQLAEAEAQRDWSGYWFHRRVAKRRLGPACQIASQRTAFVGSGLQEGQRLTLDRRVHGVLTDRWCLSPEVGGVHLLVGQVILELKFRSALPAHFKQLIAAMNLNPASVSK